MDTVGIKFQDLRTQRLVSLGDKVLCVFSDSANFTEGQVYDVVSSSLSSVIGVEGDMGRSFTFTSSRFEVLPEDDDPLDFSLLSDQSQKADAGKIDPRMIEVDLGLALSAVQAVLEYGKAKYGQRAGWKQVDMDRYEPAARRHRISRDLGEERDAESGLLHLAHEITNNLFILQTMIEQNPDVDFTTYNSPPTDHRKAA